MGEIANRVPAGSLTSPTTEVPLHRSKSSTEAVTAIIAKFQAQFEEVDADTDTSDEDYQNQDDSSGGGWLQTWTTDLFPILKSLAADPNGIVGKSVVNFMKKYLKGTRLVFVVGQTGAGKSTFIGEISHADPHVEKTRNSGTKTYEACPAIIDGEQFLFIDTPGFGAADLDDMDCFKEIIVCLGPFVTVAGLIFVTGGNQQRFTAQERKTIQWIKCFCGPEFYKNITIMTSKWDMICEDDLDELWDSMISFLEGDPSISEILNPAMKFEYDPKQYEGGKVYHHGAKLDEGHPRVPPQCLSARRENRERAAMAIAMIKKRYKNIADVKLQVVHEMDKGISWYNTAAAKVLKYNPRDIKLDIQDGMLHVFVESEVLDRVGKSGLDYPQPATERRPSMDKPQYQPALDEKSNEGSTWLGKIWAWLTIAKDVALFFKKA
ncbi:P-loop containing nucleoside triphosphate hydrolase protein [Astrocystis sublimbata]|nr:P-loop containing nucleoside triphosphate hydrolase protein [Astrocystis sublimbata]